MTFRLRLKKLTVLFAVFILLAGLVPALPARASDGEPAGKTEKSAMDGDFAGKDEAPESGYFVNPLYADILTEEDILGALTALPEKRGAKASEPPSEYAPEGETPELCTTIAEAAAVLRQGMKQRLNEIPVYTAARMTSYVTLILNAAKAHTGNPVEGDYIAWQYGGGTYTNVAIKAESTGEVLYYRLTYMIVYYTSAEDEAEMDEAVSDVLETLGTAAMTDERSVIRAVYDYVCEHVTYDYGHLGDETYKYQFTAYAALLHGTAVCQGYSLLMYRLLLENGIDCRVITGNNHAWNIVKLGDLYYYADSTWDAGAEHYVWFLIGSNYFASHFPDERSLALLADYQIFSGIGTTEILSFDYMASGIRVSWKAVGDAEFYAVEKQTVQDGGANGEWTEFARTSETSAVDPDTEFGRTYRYRVHPGVTVFTAEPCIEVETVRRPFNDVPETASFAGAVSWAVSRGIVRGTGETTFSPYAECERYQFAVMLYKYAGMPAVNVNAENFPFADVTEDDSFCHAVAWAYMNGIISGTSKTKFSPHGTIKRYQAVQMLYKMCGKPDMGNVVNRFTDVSETDSFYRAVQWAVKKGITAGTSADRFSPQVPCLRYQMTVFLYKYAKKYGL